MQFVKITVIFALKKELLSCFPLEAKTIKIIYKSFLSHWHFPIESSKISTVLIYKQVILYQLCKN